MKSLVITYERTADGRSGQYELALNLTDNEATDRHTVQTVIERANGALQQRENRSVVVSHRIVEHVTIAEIMPELSADDQRAAYAAAADKTPGMAPSHNEVAREAQVISNERLREGLTDGSIKHVTLADAHTPLAGVVDAVRSGGDISLDNPHIVEAVGVVLSGNAGDADGDGLISLDEIVSDTPAKKDWNAIREENVAKRTAAFSAGVTAVENVLNGDVPYDLDLFIDLFKTGNPYKMVAYGDEGVERPAWQDGFNRRLYAHYGVETLAGGYDDRPEDVRSAMNGRRADGEHFGNFKEAETAARDLTQAYGIPFWPEDRTASTSPRFAVITGFQVGEPVSYGFNGDSYIAGRITAINDSLRIITVSDGKTERKFWRRKQTASWKFDQTWSLMHGWHTDQNPSF